MFRSDAQQARVAAALVNRLVRLHGAFDERGRTERFSVLYADSALTRGERALLLAAETFWAYDRELRLMELFALDGGSLRVVGSLLVALGMEWDGSDPHPVDQWLATWEHQP